MLKYLFDMEKVKDLLRDPVVRIIDCRFELGKPDSGRQAYKQDHIPGAFHLDLEMDLAGAKQTHGGRHPLPDLNEFAKKLGQVGIDSTSKVIAYDDQAGMMASRLWWMLTYLGHDSVYVMDGGYSQWKDERFPVTREIPQIQSKTFIPHPRSEMLADMEQVRQKMGRSETILIDSREEKRYRGLEEPIDRIPGHIPGAVNYFWKNNMEESGIWKTTEEQKQRFQAVDPDKEVIVYCGSGVSACPNILTLQALGYPNVKLYVGSWSDWSSYEDNPVGTKKD